MGIEKWLKSSALAAHRGQVRGETNSLPLSLLERSGWSKVRAESSICEVLVVVMGGGGVMDPTGCRVEG